MGLTECVISTVLADCVTVFWFFFKFLCERLTVKSRYQHETAFGMSSCWSSTLNGIREEAWGISKSGTKRAKNIFKCAFPCFKSNSATPRHAECVFASVLRGISYQVMEKKYNLLNKWWNNSHETRAGLQTAKPTFITAMSWHHPVSSLLVSLWSRLLILWLQHWCFQKGLGDLVQRWKTRK